MYRTIDHARMIADEVRMQAYEAAIGRLVKPGSRVLDAGTGLGLFCIQAIRAGAGEAVGFDQGPVVRLAEEIAQLNGAGSQCSFADADVVTLRDVGQFDLIVSDMRSVVPINRNNVLFHADVAPGLLSAGGTIIPARDSIYVVPVIADHAHDSFISVHERAESELDLRPVLTQLENSWHRIAGDSIRPLAEEQLWASLDYRNVERRTDCSQMIFEVTTDGQCHGLVVWFDAKLCDGVEYTTNPFVRRRATAYGVGYFPVVAPLKVGRGDRLRVTLKAEVPATGSSVWTWSVDPV